MSLQEFSVALVAVIVGLGLTELLGNLNRLIRARGRVRWHPLPLIWAALALMMVVNYWWGTYLGLTTVREPSSAGAYLFGLATPIILYLICAAALPSRVPQTGVDLQESYFAESRYFFLLLAAYFVSIPLVGAAAQETPVVVMRWVASLIAASLLLTRSGWYHWVATLVFLAILLLRMFGMTARPG